MKNLLVNMIYRFVLGGFVFLSFFFKIFIIFFRGKFSNLYVGRREI